MYLEYTAYFPSRSGSEVVFLEQAYPNPKWLFPTTFAVQSVILSYGSANATGEYFQTSMYTKVDEEMMTVMAKYLIAISGHTGTNWQIKGTALACYSLATLSKWSQGQYQSKQKADGKKPWYSIQNTHIGFQTASVS